MQSAQAAFAAKNSPAAGDAEKGALAAMQKARADLAQQIAAQGAQADPQAAAALAQAQAETAQAQATLAETGKAPGAAAPSLEKGAADIKAALQGKGVSPGAGEEMQAAGQHLSEAAAHAAAGQTTAAQAGAQQAQAEMAQAAAALAPSSAPEEPGSWGGKSPQTAGSQGGGVVQGAAEPVADSKAQFVRLPERDRAAIQQSQSEKYPQQYATKVEQYLRNLAEGK